MIHFWGRFILMVCLAALTSVGFQNCGGIERHDAFNTSSLRKLSCDEILLDGYKNSFYNFTINNRCNNCHFVGGTGKTAFADTSLVQAMDAFLSMGDSSAEKLAIRSVSDHQSGYTGPHLKASVEETIDSWDTTVSTYNNCSSNQIANNKTRFLTLPKPIGLIDSNGDPIKDNEFIFIEWPLDEQDFARQATGASFSIGVKYTTEFKDTPVYVFTFPTLKTGNQTITILGVNVLVNGEKFGRTTFDFSTVTLLPHSTHQLSNIGLDLQPPNNEFILEGDVVQIEFDYFEVVD